MLNLLAAPAATVKDRAADNTVVVSPHHVSIAAGAGAAGIISVAGYPTGRHHSLIKASEARLAVQSGAAEVWVAVDALLGDATSLLTDLITVREACPQPVQLGLILPASENAFAAAQAATQAGFDKLIFSSPSQAEQLQEKLAGQPAGLLPAEVWPAS